ncbi:MAG: hypothetical protein H7226_06790 [Salinibacterium sp.]|nr:hypothetical protein [Salinibacterium sp.]
MSNARGKFLATIALTLSMVGCASTTSAPTLTSVPTPFVEAASPSPAPTVARVTVLADSITITDSTGTRVTTVDYFTAPVEVVRVLTNAFGFAPETVLPENCACDGLFRVQHNWDGFLLGETSINGDSNTPGESPYSPATTVWVTAASVRGVIVDTFDRARVGDELASLPASDPGVTEHYSVPDQLDRTYFHMGTIALPDVEPSPGTSGTNLSYSIVVTSTAGEGVVSKIIAPVSNGFGL